MTSSLNQSIIYISADDPLRELTSLFEVRSDLADGLLHVSVVFDSEAFATSCMPEFYDVRLTTCKEQIWVHVLDIQNRERTAKQVIKLIERFFNVKVSKDDKWKLLKKRGKFLIKYYYSWEDNKND